MKTRAIFLELVAALLFGVITVLATMHFLESSDSRTIKVGVENYAPFISLVDGRMVGISAFALQEIAGAMDLKLVPTEELQRSKLIDLLLAGKVDVITSIKRTSEYENQALFTEPYITVHSTQVSIIENPTSICVGRGFAIEAWIRENKPNLSIIDADADADCIVKMINREVDSIAIDDISLSAQQTPKSWYRTPLAFLYPLSFAVSKDRPDLLEILNVSLAKTRAVGVDLPGTFTEVRKIIEERCALCHGDTSQIKEIRLDSPEQIKIHARTIYMMVKTGKMPFGNVTSITPAERAAILKWFDDGASTAE